MHSKVTQLICNITLPWYPFVVHTLIQIRTATINIRYLKDEIIFPNSYFNNLFISLKRAVMSEFLKLKLQHGTSVINLDQISFANSINRKSWFWGALGSYMDNLFGLIFLVNLIFLGQ